jgi:hypothetical protein
MFKRRKPSEYLRGHLAGDGYDLDDLVHAHQSDPAYEDVIEEVLTISKRFSTADYPIGIGNPASDDDLRVLAERLESEGR